MGIVAHKPFGAVYLIRNVQNGAIYVGITTQKPISRWRQHKSALVLDKHCNPHLQRAWNKYGANAFVFEVIQQCGSADELNNAEIGWIEWYRCAGINLYNQKDGGGFGGSPNEDMRRRLSEAGKGRKISAETARRVSEATRGVKKTYTPESYARMIASRQKPHTAEHKAKISAASKGRKATDAQRAAARLRRHSEATRQKMSAVQKGRTFSDEARQRMSEAAARRGKQYELISPDGQVYSTTNLSAFCREHTLKLTAIHDLARGRYSQHKGWRCSRKESLL